MMGGEDRECRRQTCRERLQRLLKLDAPLIVVAQVAWSLIEAEHGGFWPAVRWAFWRQWTTRTWGRPTWWVVGAWLRWAEWTGRVVVRNGERHAAECEWASCAEDQPGVPAWDCLSRAAPRWLRRWV